MVFARTPYLNILLYLTPLLRTAGILAISKTKDIFFFTKNNFLSKKRKIHEKKEKKRKKPSSKGVNGVNGKFINAVHHLDLINYSSPCIEDQRDCLLK